MTELRVTASAIDPNEETQKPSLLSPNGAPTATPRADEGLGEDGSQVSYTPRTTMDEASFNAMEANIEEELQRAMEVDQILDKIDSSMVRLDKVKASVIKRRVAESDFLTQVEAARDVLQIALQGDKLQLDAIYGGQCVRIGKLRYMLETISLSDMYKQDQRWKHIQARVESVESVLQELGTYKKWVPPVPTVSSGVARQGSIARGGSTAEMIEMDRAVIIPTLSGVWDDISQIELEAWNFLKNQVDEFGGFQVMQNGKDVEIFVGEDVKGRFLFDEKTLEFKGTLNEEEVVITVGDEEIKFSNGGMWEKRPVDIAGVWDKCISEEDLTPIRITVSQKGKKITARAPGDGGFTLEGKISGETIHVSQGEQEEQEEGETDSKTANALETGKIDETSRNIMWQDGSVWCKRPKIDVEGTWDEAIGTGSYNKGMILTMTGSEVSSNHVTLKGKGSVNDEAEISFNFEKLGETAAQYDGEHKIVWADGIVWERRTQDVTEPVNVLEDKDIPEWRRKEGFGPLRRSFYLDPLVEDNDAPEMPDLFTHPQDGHADAKDGHADAKDGNANSKDGNANSKDGNANSKDGNANSKDGNADAKDGKDAAEIPDQFWKNEASTGHTQKAFSSAYEGFAQRIDEISSLEEVLAAQKGPGITLPQNWMVWMVHRVFLNDPSLTTLSFSNMEMPNSKDEQRVGPKLMESLKHNTYLENLELQNSSMLSDLAKPLSAALRVNTTLKSLNLEGNSLDANGLLLIADAMTENDGLEILKVQHQKCGTVGVQVEEKFSEALKKNKTLVKLGIQLSNPHHRDQIDRKLMRNIETRRKKRHAARASTAAASGASTEENKK